MLDLVLKFAACCRADALKVSTAEVLDTVRQLEFVEVVEQAQFKAVLKANFAKSRRDQNHFDRLYDLFFHAIRPEAKLEVPAEAAQLEAELGDLLADELQQDQELKAVFDFLTGDPMGYLALMNQLRNQEDENARQIVKSNLGPLARRLSVMMKLNRMREKVIQFGDQRPGKATEFLERRLETARQMLTQDPQPQNDGLKKPKAHDKPLKTLGDRPFASLTPEELMRMRDIIEHLVRKFKDIVTRRHKARRKGILDVKRTLRHAARFQGIPLEVQYRNRPPRKARIVTLCDVSGSVWSAARFMLHMLYSLQECFAKVRSFVFVSDLAEVTGIFERHAVNEAIERIITQTGIELQELTDYGEMLQQFRNDYMAALNQKTTLILVGDGRSNYMHPRESILGEMRRKCRRIIWLNPEPEAFWFTGDSEMRTYMAYCHEVRECANLNQLIDFVESLVL